jgi:hypothetical protein
VACDNDTTSTGGEGGIVEVFCAETGGLACLGKGIGVLVFSNTANVYSRVWWEDVLFE